MQKGSDKDHKNSRRSLRERLGLKSARSSGPSPNQNITEIHKNMIPEDMDWSSLLSEYKSWEETHQLSKFMELLGKFDQTLQADIVQSLIGLIPDVSGVRLGALVKAVTHVLHVAVEFPMAKRDICEFVQETLQAIIDYMNVMGNLEGCLSDTAQTNFEKLSRIINDICKWANEQLARRLSITTLAAEELEIWRNKLRDVKQDIIGKTLMVLEIRQKIENTKVNVEKSLGNRIASMVRYDEQEKRSLQVFPGTRKAVIDRVISWLEHPSAKPYFWITGPPGTGKSTLAVHITRHLIDEKLLYAQYFITRNIPQTTSVENFFPTIALQLAKSPMAASVIENVLPDVFSGSGYLNLAQAKSLLVEPIKKIANERARLTQKAVKAIAEKEIKAIACKWLKRISPESVEKIAHTIVKEIMEETGKMAEENIRPLERTLAMEALAEKLVGKIAATGGIVGIAEGTIKMGEGAVKTDEDAFSGSTVKNEDLVKAAENIIHKLAKRAVGQMVVVIIDALDELDKAKELTSILWELAPELPVNVKVILTSRPEDDMILGRPDFIETISLKTEDTIEEVGEYICAQLESLAMKQKPKWEHWPPSPLTKMLSTRANGLFLYGATVVTWITGRVTRRPYERDEIIDMVQDFVPGDLNSLYNNILVMWAKDPDGWDKPENDYQYGKIKGTSNSTHNATDKVRLDPDQLVQFRCIMQCLLTLELPLDIAAIGTLCGLKGALVIMQQLRSLLVRDIEDIRPDMIPGMHRSFREYITSTQTVEAFRINIAEAHLATAKACMQLAVKGSIDHEESKAVDYANGFWPRHLHLSNCTHPDDKVKKLISAMADRDPGAYTTMNVICTICEIGWTWLKNAGSKPQADVFLHETLRSLHTILKKKYNVVKF